MLQYHPLDKEKMLEICQCISYTPNFTMLEFGVATGNTMSAMIDALMQVGIKPKQVIGFDSFEGLPTEDPQASPNPDWFPTAFNIISELGNKGIKVTKENGIELIKSRFAVYQLYDIDVQLIIGWYDKLNKDTVLEYNIQPAQYIHIDCDMYISAIQAMTWLAQSDLIDDGCIVRYDDWQNDSNMGENKAHFEITNRFGYKASLIHSNFPGNIFFRFTK